MLLGLRHVNIKYDRQDWANFRCVMHLDTNDQCRGASAAENDASD